MLPEVRHDRIGDRIVFQKHQKIFTAKDLEAGFIFDPAIIGARLVAGLEVYRPVLRDIPQIRHPVLHRIAVALQLAAVIASACLVLDQERTLGALIFDTCEHVNAVILLMNLYSLDVPCQ